MEKIGRYLGIGLYADADEGEARASAAESKGSAPGPLTIGDVARVKIGGKRK